MKKLLITIFLFLFSWTASLANSKVTIIENENVNSLISKGWRLHSTSAFASADSEGYMTNGNYYHLTKGKELISCIQLNMQVTCFKP